MCEGVCLCVCVWTQHSPETPVLCYFPPVFSPSPLYISPAVSSQYGQRETNYIITPTVEVGTSATRCFRQVEKRVKINPLFNPKSLKSNLWALLAPINGSCLSTRRGSVPALVRSPGPPDTTLSKAPRHAQMFRSGWILFRFVLLLDLLLFRTFNWEYTL